LTVIGQFAQAVVARKIAGNSFVIRTNKPRVEVSWQVTGVRQDAYANLNRIRVEEEKPERERGAYLHPEAFGGAAANSTALAAKPARRRRNR
jgi:trimeric autotransporter adhesin